jgi:hypothetical protein
MDQGQRLPKDTPKPWWRARFIPLTITLLALALYFPALGAGFFEDDWVGMAALEGYEISNARPLDLYLLSSGRPEDVSRLIHEGALPWWTQPNFRFALWRPIASASFLLDHTLFGLDPLGAHVHSLLWFLALLASIWTLYRRAFEPSIALLAFALFALNEGHWEAVIWVCGRHLLISATLGAFALALSLRPPDIAPRFARPASLLLFAGAFVSGEGALQVLPLMLAVDLSRPEPLRARIRRAAAPVAITAVYMLLYVMHARGVRGSGNYADPMDDPLRYALRHVHSLPLLLSDLLAGIPTGAANAEYVLIAIGFGMVPVFVVLCRKAFRSVSSEERVRLWALGIGAIFAILPSLASVLSGRVLLIPSIGIAPCIAVVLRYGYRMARGTLGDARRQRINWGVVVAVFGVLHLLLPPALIPYITSEFANFGLARDAVLRSAPLGDDPATDVVVLRAPDPIIGPWGGVTRAMLSGARVHHWWSLSMSPHEHDVVRVGPSTLEISPRGRWFESFQERVFRSRRAVMPAGTRVRTAEFEAEVVEERDGIPVRVRFTFDRSLDDPKLRFLCFQEQRLSTVAMPPVGERLVLPKLEP